MIPPTSGIVDEYYNDSTGEGDDGEIDARGPWNEGGDWTYVESPAFAEGAMASAGKSGDTSKAFDDLGLTRKRSKK